MEGEMVERRDLMMGSGLVAGLAALMTPAAAAAAPQDSDQQVVQAVNRLTETVATELETLRNGPWRAVALVREQQRTWLRSTQKYPDFIEVGVEVWDGLHDWHVHYRQPINMARMTDGRYAMVFMFTSIILRPEQAPMYVGLPYDGQAPRR
jgi:hypothetical protein